MQDKSSIFSNVPAVDGLTVSIERGSVVGYIGPNGAGKSTTVKMLTSILGPSSGRISVAGLVPSSQRIVLARRIGAMFGQRTTSPTSSVSARASSSSTTAVSSTTATATR